MPLKTRNSSQGIPTADAILTHPDRRLSMAHTRVLRSRYLTAMVLGVLAALVTLLPPFHLADRLDGRIFDLWSGLMPAPPDPDIVLVTFDDAAWLPALVELAREDGAKLLVTTLPHPPPDEPGPWVLGPTELALGPRLLRRTDWQHGGHLWFPYDASGLVRTELPRLAESGASPSLALAAHAALTRREPAARTPQAAASGPAADAAVVRVTSPSEPAAPSERAARVTAELGVDGVRRIRYRDPDAFTRLTPSDLAARNHLLSDRIVVAGRPVPLLPTPVGPLPDHELVAQILSGYRSGSLVSESPAARALPWLLVLGLLWPAAAGSTRSAWRWLWPAAGGAALLGASGVAFAAAGSWVPVAGPGVLLLTSSLLLLMRPRRAARAAEARPQAAARALLESDDLERAWALYREMPPTQELFEELYALGCALQAAGYLEPAADVFHRIALVDVRYRDVARRLVRSTHAGVADLNEDFPTALGRYEILESIGRGSTGRVFLALDPEINRIVALKVVDLTADFEPEALEEATVAFRREAETAGRLNHPGIVTIYDIGEADGRAYIAMEYLKGRHLSDFTTPDALLPVPLVIELGARTADALDYAHRQNVVHRDIKPSNIMYDSVSGDLKITDFGIARLIDVSRTRTGVVLGTPSFMAPEQLEGKNVNGNTDLFALGVSLYELLTGRLPFRGASMTSLMFVIANEPHEPVTAVRPELPRQLDAVIDIALSKDPGERFSSGAGMADALRAVGRELA